MTVPARADFGRSRALQTLPIRGTNGTVKSHEIVLLRRFDALVSARLASAPRDVRDGGSGRSGDFFRARVRCARNLRRSTSLDARLVRGQPIRQIRPHFRIQIFERFADAGNEPARLALEFRRKRQGAEGRAWLRRIFRRRHAHDGRRRFRLQRIPRDFRNFVREKRKQAGGRRRVRKRQIRQRPRVRRARFLRGGDADVGRARRSADEFDRRYREKSAARVAGFQENFDFKQARRERCVHQRFVRRAVGRTRLRRRFRAALLRRLYACTRPFGRQLRLAQGARALRFRRERRSRTRRRRNREGRRGNARFLSRERARQVGARFQR